MLCTIWGWFLEWYACENVDNSYKLEDSYSGKEKMKVVQEKKYLGNLISCERCPQENNWKKILDNHPEQ